MFATVPILNYDHDVVSGLVFWAWDLISGEKRMSYQGLRRGCWMMTLGSVLMFPGLRAEALSPMSVCYADAHPMYEMEANENTRVAVREVAVYFATGTTFTCAHARGADHGVGTGETNFFAGLEVVGLSGVEAVEHLVERFPVYELEMRQTEPDEFWVFFWAGLMEYRLQVRQGRVVALRYGTSGP